MYWLALVMALIALVLAISSYFRVAKLQENYVQALREIASALQSKLDKNVEQQSANLSHCCKKIDALEHALDLLHRKWGELKEANSCMQETIRHEGDECLGRDAKTGRAIYAPHGTVLVGVDPESNARVYRDPQSGRSFYR